MIIVRSNDIKILLFSYVFLKYFTITSIKLYAFVIFLTKYDGKKTANIENISNNS